MVESLTGGRRIGMLVLSCDAYAPLWEAHFRELERHWPDCPFSKLLLTNRLDPGIRGVEALQAGDDRGWSDNLLTALDTIQERFDWLLLTFDDLMLVQRVDNDRLGAALDSFFRVGGDCIQLIRWHNRIRRVDEQIGSIAPGSLYRPTCVWALWRVETLRQLLVPGESAWQFERNGSPRSDQFDGFYAVHEPIFLYHNTVIRGRIVPGDVKRFNLTPGDKLRPMTAMQWLRFKVRYLAFKSFLSLVPTTMQRRFRNNQ